MNLLLLVLSLPFAYRVQAGSFEGLQNAERLAQAARAAAAPEAAGAAGGASFDASAAPRCYAPRGAAGSPAALAASSGRSSAARAEPPAPRGLQGFQNGFGRAFQWLMSPSTNAYKSGLVLSLVSGNPLWFTGGAILAGLLGALLIFPAMLGGVGAGLFGAVFGAKQR